MCDFEIFYEILKLVEKRMLISKVNIEGALRRNEGK